MSRGDQVLDHPSADELNEYVESTLSASAELRVRHHVEGCETCLALVQDLSDYPNLEPPSEAFVVSDEELRSTLGSLRANLLAEDSRAEDELAAVESSPTPEISAPSAPLQQAHNKPHQSDPARAETHPSDASSSPTPIDRPTRTTTLPPRTAWTTYWPLLAAASILAALGSTWTFFRANTQLEGQVAVLVGQLQQLQAENLRPRANPRIAQLLPTDDPLRSQRLAGISLTEADVLIIVPTDDPLPQGDYAVEIRQPKGDTVLTIEHLEPQALGLTFTLPRNALAAGQYLVWIVLDGPENSRRSYDLRITP